MTVAGFAAPAGRRAPEARQVARLAAQAHIGRRPM